MFLHVATMVPQHASVHARGIHKNMKRPVLQGRQTIEDSGFLIIYLHTLSYKGSDLLIM